MYETKTAMMMMDDEQRDLAFEAEALYRPRVIGWGFPRADTTEGVVLEDPAAYTPLPGVQTNGPRTHLELKRVTVDVIQMRSSEEALRRVPRHLEPELEVMSVIMEQCNGAFHATMALENANGALDDDTREVFHNYATEQIYPVVRRALARLHTFALRSRQQEKPEPELMAPASVADAIVRLQNERALGNIFHLLQHIKSAGEYVPELENYIYRDRQYSALVFADGIPLYWAVFSLGTSDAALSDDDDDDGGERRFKRAAPDTRERGTMVLHGWSRTLVGYMVEPGPETRVNGAFALSLLLDVGSAMLGRPVSFVYMLSLDGTDRVLARMAEMLGAATALNRMAQGTNAPPPYNVILTSAELVQGDELAAAKHPDVLLVTKPMRTFWRTSDEWVEPRKQTEGWPTMDCQVCGASAAAAAPEGDPARGAYCGPKCHAAVCALLSDATI